MLNGSLSKKCNCNYYTNATISIADQLFQEGNGIESALSEMRQRVMQQSFYVYFPSPTTKSFKIKKCFCMKKITLKEGKKKKQIHLWTFVTNNILYTCIYIVYMGVNKSVFKGHLDTTPSQPELVE